MLLTDEEIWDCKTPCIEGDCPYGIGDKPVDDKNDSVCCLCEYRVRAKAQLKKVVEQLQTVGTVMPKGVRDNSEHLYVFPLIYYKALLEEVKE